jgi:hypothetical protein
MASTLINTIGNSKIYFLMNEDIQLMNLKNFNFPVILIQIIITLLTQGGEHKYVIKME